MEEYMLIAMAISLATALFVSFLVSAVTCRRKSFRKINKILKKSKKFKNLGQLTDMAAEVMEKNASQHEEMTEHIRALQASSVKSVKKVACERFDATHDIGGHMSFSLALLDEEDNGVLLTNIYMEDRTFLYFRSVQNGRSETNLSQLEEQVIQKAMEK